MFADNFEGDLRMGEKWKQFLNLGFTDEDISKYDHSLAKENLRALTRQAFLLYLG